MTATETSPPGTAVPVPTAGTRTDQNQGRGARGRGRRFPRGAGRGGRGTARTRNYAGHIKNSNPDFKGATEAMNLHVFLTFEECNNKSMYTTTLQYLGMYVDKNMTYSNDLIPVYRDLEAPEIPLLPGEIPKNADRKETALGKLLWNEEVKLYTKRVEKLKDNMSAIYAVVWGQCSEPMHAKLQSKDQFDIKDKERDCIWLLQAIKSIMLLTTRELCPRTTNSSDHGSTQKRST